MPDRESGKTELLTWALTLSGSTTLYSYMWAVGDGMKRIINLNEVPLDPQTGGQYIYAVNINQSKFQVAGISENSLAKNSLVGDTYADAGYTALVNGNHQVGLVTKQDDKTFLTTVPSMIFVQSGSNNVLNSGSILPVVNIWTNLAQKVSGSTTQKTADVVIRDIQGNTKAKMMSVDVSDIVSIKDEGLCRLSLISILICIQWKLRVNLISVTSK